MAKKVIPGALTDAYKKGEGDFAPDLVGFQFTKSASIFTLGNFSLTTNNDPFTGEIFNSGILSDFITLDTLNLTPLQSETLEQNSNTLNVRLRNNKKSFLSYVYFGEAKKFLETEITDIIEKWKGSLFIEQSNLTNTVFNYSYDSFTNESYFSFPINVAQNTFNLITEENAFTLNETEINYLRQNFLSYQIQNDYGYFDVIGYTGNSSVDSYIKVKVVGQVWPTLSASSNGSFTYHFRPSDFTLSKYFFSTLSDFQLNLLNRYTVPKYTITIQIPTVTDAGYTFLSTNSYTWPTTDGYNIDVNTRDYGEYLELLFNLTNTLDFDTTNIMTRRLVATSILEFDSPGDGTDQTGRKMDKLLKIWGREYDEVKRYIDGISFANVVTYDGQDNTPDELIKIMASTLGFDTIQSFSNNDLVNYLASTSNVVFSGQSDGYTMAQLDTELWRRLIINAWWLWKSKGARKVIEFFLNLFRIDECLIDLNEFVYLAEQKLDYEEVVDLLNIYYGGEVDGDILFANDAQDGFISIDNFPIDTEGYPRIIPDRPDYYFQLDGFWYDGGVPANTKADINGNNPHFGPYDYGQKYFNKFRCFIDGFVFSSETVNLNTLTFNYFNDYTFGTIENTPIIETSIDSTGFTTTNTFDLVPEYFEDSPFVDQLNDGRVSSGVTVTSAGSWSYDSNTGSNSIKISFSTGQICDICPDSVITQNNTGLVVSVENNETIVLKSEQCCKIYGYLPYPDVETGNGTTCYWCPPLSQFASDPETTELFYFSPEGVKTKPSKKCCILRGGFWDEGKKNCVNKPIITLQGDSLQVLI